ncbi:MAG: CPBP family intramembrane metalloprotease [Clostridia bacterium]|nr:CPBP family intramembrane metalloprotease [Clostridia bacterium]
MNNNIPSSADPFLSPLLPPTVSPEETRRFFSLVGLAYATLALAHQLTAILFQYLLLYLSPSVLSAWWTPWVLSILPLYTVAIGLMWLILRKIPASPHNTDHATGVTASAVKPRFTLGHWLILLVIAFGCMTAGGLVGNIIMAILSSVMDYDYANALNEAMAQSPLWATFIATCICAPLGEELLFRKLLIDRTRRYGDLPSILLSGLLFGLFHGNLFQFFYAVAVGMILAYVYTRTGSYWWCVAMHAAINFMGSIVTPTLAAMLPADLVSFETPLQPLILLLLLLWQYGMLIAGIVLLWALFPRRKLSRGPLPLYRENAASLVLGNSGMIVACAVMGLVMALNLWPMG